MSRTTTSHFLLTLCVEARPPDELLQHGIPGHDFETWLNARLERNRAAQILNAHWGPQRSDAWRTNETLKTALESFFTNETAMNSTRTGQFIRERLDQPDGRIPAGLAHWPLTRLNTSAGNGLRHYQRHRQHPVQPLQSGASPPEGPPPREFEVGTRKHGFRLSRVLQVI
ncbi:hypothetical protein JCM5350_006316 [Sporobolomyces pararoseus]